MGVTSDRGIERSLTLFSQLKKNVKNGTDVVPSGRVSPPAPTILFNETRGARERSAVALISLGRVSAPGALPSVK